MTNSLENGTIKISALINPSELKLHPAIVMLEMESAEAMQNFLDRFEECPRVIQIFKTMGGYNLIALVVAETQRNLREYLDGKMLLTMQQRNTTDQNSTP